MQRIQSTEGATATAAVDSMETQRASSSTRLDSESCNLNPVKNLPDLSDGVAFTHQQYPLDSRL